MELAFEWDEEKAATNLAKHNVSFLTAAAIFDEEIIEHMDDREDYGEIRWVALGIVDGEIYRVVYTWRGDDRVRIISAQKADKHEQRTYYRQLHHERN